MMKFDLKNQIINYFQDIYVQKLDKKRTRITKKNED